MKSDGDECYRQTLFNVKMVTFFCSDENGKLNRPLFKKKPDQADNIVAKTKTHIIAV